MTLSLYDISIPNYLQILGSTINVLNKGAEYAEENSLDLAQLLETKLCPDMQSLKFQLLSVAHHSLGAINGIKQGVFSPPRAITDIDYKSMQGLLKDTLEQIQAITEDEINQLSGKAMKFQMGDFEMPFVAENFIQSFSMPNFYFHAATTYDILRMIGVPLGKEDFLGNMRMG